MEAIRKLNFSQLCSSSTCLLPWWLGTVIPGAAGTLTDMRPSDFQERQDTKQMEPPSDQQLWSAARVEGAWLPMQLPEVSTKDVRVWTWSCVGRTAAEGAALMQSISQQSWV